MGSERCLYDLCISLLKVGPCKRVLRQFLLAGWLSVGGVARIKCNSVVRLLIPNGNMPVSQSKSQEELIKIRFHLVNYCQLQPASELPGGLVRADRWVPA